MCLTVDQSGGIYMYMYVITHTAYTLRFGQYNTAINLQQLGLYHTHAFLFIRVLLHALLPLIRSYSLTFEVIHLQHLQCSMFLVHIKSISQYPPGGGWVVMEPIVPAGLFGLVSGRALPLELMTFDRRNTNPTSHTIPLLDTFHYSSDIVEG